MFGRPAATAAAAHSEDGTVHAGYAAAAKIIAEQVLYIQYKHLKGYEALLNRAIISRHNAEATTPRHPCVTSHVTRR